MSLGYFVNHVIRLYTPLTPLYERGEFVGYFFGLTAPARITGFPQETY